MDTKPGFLYVANYDSDVGYAWWLMESFWVALAKHYIDSHQSYLAYPSISKIPQSISNAPIICEKIDFTLHTYKALQEQILFIKKYKIETIYFSDQPSFHYSHIYYRLAGIKYIIHHDHTPGLRTKPKGLKLILKKLKARIPFINTDAYIGATDFVKKRAIEVIGIPEKKCFSAPNGLPELNHPPLPLDLEKTFNIEPGKTVMISVGRAHPVKGVPFILECMSEIIKLGVHELQFIYVGDGPYLNDFKQQAKLLGIEKYVTFAGRRSDVQNILAASDFAIQASKAEVGYSLSILEYMQHGLATIVSDNTSVCESIANQETGIIYKEDDKHDAVQAILKLLKNNGIRTKMGSKAKKSILEKYNLTCTHAALIKAINKTIKKANTA